MKIKQYLNYIEYVSSFILKVPNKLNHIAFFFMPIFIPSFLRNRFHIILKIYDETRNLLHYKNDYDQLVVRFDKLYYSLVDHESLIIISPNFEFWLKPHLKLKKGETFIDIGAHIGKYTIPASKILGKTGYVFAFEADENNFKHLEQGIKMNKLENVVYKNIALWKEKTTVKLYASEMSGRHSLKGHRNQYSFVKADTLDNIMLIENLLKVDWIKIDVEGSEPEVLKGSEHTIKKYRPKIICEIMPENLKQVLDYFHQLEYRITFIGSRKDYAYNILAVPESCKLNIN